MNSNSFLHWKSTRAGATALAWGLLVSTTSAVDYSTIAAGTWSGSSTSRNATYGTTTTPGSIGPGASDNLTLTVNGIFSLQNSTGLLTGGLNRAINNITSTVAGANIASGGASSGNFTSLTVNGNLTLSTSGVSLALWNTSGAPTTQGAMTVTVGGNISIGTGTSLYLGLIEDTGVPNGGNSYGSYLNGFTANSTESGKGQVVVDGKLMLHRNTTIATFGDLNVGATGVVTLTGAGSANLTHSGTFNKTIQARSLAGSGIVENSIILGANGTTSSNATLHLQTLATTNATYSGTLRDGSGTGAVLNLTMSGSGRQALSGNNTYSGSTTVSAGVLEAAHSQALGGNGTVTVTGGSLLVGANGSIDEKSLFLDKAIAGDATAAQAALQFGASYSNTIGTAGALTLEQDSIIDLGTGGVVIHFREIANLDSYILHIFNWEGDTVWSGSPGGGKDQFYVDEALGGAELDNIRFYSGTTTSSFISSGFQVTGGSFNNEIIAVPEPGTWVGAALLLAWAGFRLHRRASKAGV